jgi:2-keto-3-deoxy-L-rhamnonate aldolase RhmA
MAQAKSLKQALQEQRLVFGLFCSTPHAQVIELIGAAGFDFVIIDTEHTLINPETLEHMLRTADAAGIAALVRVPDASAKPILRALDAGARGVVVPAVRSRADAEAIVRASRYYPAGERSLNAGRSARFGGLDLAAHLRQANDEVVVVAMIEDRQGLAALDEILAVPGIDLVLEGAADLSQSLGLPWQTRHPEVRAALSQIQATAQSRGVPFCAIPRAVEDLGPWLERGVRVFVLGDERGIAFRALQAQLERFKHEITSEKLCLSKP